MKNIILAAAAVLALGAGSAFAQGSDEARAKVADQSAQQGSRAGVLLAYATTTRSQVSIYPSFREGYSQGGNQ